MRETQITALMPNKPGELARVTSQLARYNINIRAISVADSTEYGLARILTDDAERAGAALCELGYGFVRNDVVAVEIPDSPGALSELCRQLSDASVDIRYVYATVTPGGGVALAVISTVDNDRAAEVLSA
jgi:hypothetical protein